MLATPESEAMAHRNRAPRVPELERTDAGLAGHTTHDIRRATIGRPERRPERARPRTTPLLQLWSCPGYAPMRREARKPSSSASGTRTCSMLSRSRTVTALSSSESKSTVMQNGVPISS